MYIYSLPSSCYFDQKVPWKIACVGKVVACRRMPLIDSHESLQIVSVLSHRMGVELPSPGDRLRSSYEAMQ
jgi:hypothetical protein